jgi:hypothetical protein
MSVKTIMEILTMTNFYDKTKIDFGQANKDFQDMTQTKATSFKKLGASDGKVGYDGEAWYWETTTGVRISDSNLETLVRRVEDHVDSVNELAEAYHKKFVIDEVTLTPKAQEILQKMKDIVQPEGETQ